MRGWIPRVAGVLALVLVISCADGPREQVADHLAAMVDLLEQHKENVDQAADALEAYVKEHATELAALREALAKKKQELAQRSDEMAAYASDFLVQIGPIMERAHRLMQEYPELGRSERLQKVLRSIGQK